MKKPPCILRWFGSFQYPMGTVYMIDYISNGIINDSVVKFQIVPRIAPDLPRTGPFKTYPIGNPQS